MRYKERSSALRHLFILLLFLSFIIPQATAKDDKPRVKKADYEHFVDEPRFFEDSEIVLVRDIENGTVWRSTNSGLDWSQQKDLEQVGKVFMHPYQHKVALALATGKKHWITLDQGETWNDFEIDYEINTKVSQLLSFHAEDEKKIILSVIDQSGPKAIYTTDAFKSKAKVLRSDVYQCIWAKEHPNFDSKDEKIDSDQTLCIALGKFTINDADLRLLISNDYFDKDEVEPELDDGRTVTGIVNMVAVKAYILAARRPQSSTDEMALYVTKDTKTWKRARFGPNPIQQNGYTILESTNYSLQVDVATGTGRNSIAAPMGTLFSSNEAGVRFIPRLEHTNRNAYGFLDFEKIQNIQGIALVNQVTNPDEVNSDEPKKLKTKITFDDGWTHEPLKMADSDKELHLHGMTDQSNVGRVFSSPAPGIVMGIGNTGEYLQEYSDGDLCVSDDAGMTWTCPLDGSHKYEFGGQGSILLAMKDQEYTKHMSYSLDYGKNWKEFEIGDDEVKPVMLTTVPDSTTLKFLLQAVRGRGSEQKHLLYTIDFSEMDVKDCKDDDFEIWWARSRGGEKDDAKCIMGHMQSFKRRKKDAKCFVKDKFREPLPDNSERCPCTKADFECIIDFERSEKGDCVPGKNFVDPPGKCKEPGDTYQGVSGYRRIPGNQCDGEKGDRWGNDKERTCGEVKKPSSNGKITNEIKSFSAKRFEQYFYLERGELSEDDDESIVALTDQRELFISHDHGKKWSKVEYNGNSLGEILAIIPNYYHKGHMYFLTTSETVYFTKDRGKTIERFKAPGLPALGVPGLRPLHFHEKNPGWLIWNTCTASPPKCDSKAWYTKKFGIADSWEVLIEHVENCEFVYTELSKDIKDLDDRLIFCIQYPNGDFSGPKNLVSSDDWFEHTPKTVFENVLAFATKSEFVVVAAKTGEDNKYLKVDATVDRKVFADAKFPPNLKIPHETAYTVLDSSTHSIFLHVTRNAFRDQEYGAILKSNSNGTDYTMSIDNVNRNEAGYVDFEKLMALEGVAVVNVVDNVDEVEKRASKKLKSMITFNDGAQWALIQPPEKDPNGKGYNDCKKLSKCSLHLHGYTERKDPRDTYSSASAVGLMMGIGNVGEYLTPRNDGHTFLSRDGGVTWYAVKKGRYMWEYGDQGSVIVIVAEQSTTRVLYYTTNEGKDWNEYQFSDRDMKINDITTVPSDTSLNFLLWGELDSKPTTVNVDFSGLFENKCNLKPGKPKENDYEKWEPKLRGTENNKCIFGHISTYWRKKTDRNCYNGPKIEQLHEMKNCTCTRRDFECDYNYAPDKEERCKLVEGEEPPKAEEICNQPGVEEYFTVNGYRKLPMSTCDKNEENFLGERKPCPGMEDKFKKKHGTSGVGIFFAVVIPISIAAGIGYWAYQKYEGRFGLGRIRLGDDMPQTIAALSPRRENPLVKWPVAIISGLAAVAMTIPMIFGTIFRSIRDRVGRSGGSWHSRQRAMNGRPYTSRGSFNRSRGEYSAIGANPESDLLGEDDSDDDM